MSELLSKRSAAGHIRCGGGHVAAVSTTEYKTSRSKNMQVNKFNFSKMTLSCDCE